MPKERKIRVRPPKIDIEDAFIYYCTPDEDGRLRSYEEVARRYKVSRQLIERWGSRRSWVKHRETIGKNKVSQWIEDQNELSKKINADLYKNWRKMLTLLQYEFDDIDFSQFASSDTAGKRTDVKRISARDFREFSEALKNTTDKLRVLTGQTTDYTKSDVDATVARTLDSDELGKIDEYLGKLNENRKTPAENPVSNEPTSN